MKKSFTLIFFLFLISASVFAGPFGLKMGMNLDEIVQACGGEQPEYIADDRYMIHPTKSHPLFEGYVVWVGETNGLYYIKGISREIKTTGYGTEAKQEFEKLLSPLEKKYGRFQKINKISRDSLCQDEGDFMRSIANGGRTYEAHWQATSENISEFDGLKTIAIGIKTRATYISDEAYIWIEYGFSNQDNGFGAFDDVL